MLNFRSQQIACDFQASQHKWNTPSQVNDIAACGPGLWLSFEFKIGEIKLDGIFMLYTFAVRTLLLAPQQLYVAIKGIYRFGPLGD